METTNIVDFARRGMTDALTDLLRAGAQELIASAVEAELAGYMAQFSEVRTQTGHAAVVRNGHHPARPFQTGIGPVSVRIPKVRSKDGTPVTFRSALVPPYVRRTKSLGCLATAALGQKQSYHAQKRRMWLRYIKVLSMLAPTGSGWLTTW